MDSFVFSSDAHIVEPRDFFLDRMPVHLHAHAPNATRDDKLLLQKIGDRVVHKVRLGAGSIERPTKGQTDLDLRLEDMEADGVNAELLFPSYGLLIYFIEDAEAETSACQVYNDWLIAHVGNRRHTFVPAAVLPVRDMTQTLAELKRIGGMGYTAAMLPVVAPVGTLEVPLYNDPAWDPVFALAQELGIAFTLHTGTGQSSWIVERGPGAAIINYARQMNDAASAIMYMVSGGLLDRHPKAQVAFIESGASWLPGVAERMDEVHRGHNAFVRPVLSRLPSQIIRDQVKCTFQSDRGCIASRHVTGHESLLWANDYPHLEGTYPHSREVLRKTFEGVDISEKEKADILGGTAARLFKLQRPEFMTTS